ncbi:MAG TPA: adenylate/guanylate cyclase domain-containing protein [Rectinemataceae bacterium]|nr:adenylate/guanylate cyclase domain-containing protein [Rectinemataceae bacterium]
MNVVRSVLGDKVAGVRVVPIITKIVILFSLFLLASNFVSNYVNLVLNQGEQFALANRIIVKDLTEIYGFASNQYEIWQFNRNLPDAVKGMTESSLKTIKGERSVAFGVRDDGSFLFWASKLPQPPSFPDPSALSALKGSQAGDGKISFTLDGRSYFGVFKRNANWGVWLVRADDRIEFEATSRLIFARVAGIILALTLVCLVVGTFLLRHIMRFVSKMTGDIMKMQESQRMGLLDLRGAPNDDVTYLGASFNSLASTIDNLISIFRRFVTQDIAERAYQEREVRLEGKTRQLTILFSDIKGFTFMTETLGNDIIDVLNLHYQRAIGKIHEHYGIVGSIIGDALLAVYGTIKEGGNMSLEALRSAYSIQEEAAALRADIAKKRDSIVLRRGALTDIEERMYRAVLVEVGVGIDGGEVFYGNIGSYERMANTVIGDNVNSASRLEGLTRIYKVPVVCSEFVKNEVEGASGGEFRFVEIDTVQVKGKTEGKRIYWPLREELLDKDLGKEIEAFSEGLAAYYAGKWNIAAAAWSRVSLPVAEVFRDRIAGGKVPANWNGIWAMTTK